MLNADQVLKFEAMIKVGGVLAVVPDKEIVGTTDESDGNEGKSVDVQSEIPYAPVNALLKGPLKKRDEFILQGDADQAKIAHLIFLSYPYQMSLVGKKFVWPGYRYFSSAGEGVMVYVIDNGAEPANAELATTGVIQRWLYAADIKKTPTEYIKKLSWKGHGSCSVSLVAGPKFGVAKKAKVIMVKNSFFESGVLDAFQKIINDLDERNLAGETTAGWTVISMQGGIEKSTSDINQQKLGDMILKLMNDYEVVVVIAAGGSWEEESQGIFDFNRWPQLFSLDERYSSMITVGAVTPETGTKFSDSKISPIPGRGVNVWAPGSAWCASGYTRAIADVDESSGTSVAAPIVAGLVASFLSLKGVGDQLRQSRDFAGAVLKYIQDLSQPRDPAYPSVWNGLNSLLPGPDYGWQAKLGGEEYLYGELQT
ncbi:Suppressor of the cold-sensitive snRNP biogenesis mutant brr1-1 [Lobaria immixta]|nr:Suppressor of the cold-sensitive snRNP biogenesis mutant brr1-1 [Lobaria immixta]